MRIILVWVPYPKSAHDILAQPFVLKAPTTLRTIIRCFENVTSVSKQAEVPKSSFSQKKNKKLRKKFKIHSLALGHFV
jgi:hypothetical protein